MKRRTVLTGATAGLLGPLTGCVAPGQDSGDDPEQAPGQGSGNDGEQEHGGGPEQVSNDFVAAWSQLQADAAHTGNTTATGPAGGATVRWWSDTTGLTTAPVIADGTVYIGTGLRNQSIVAFDQATGERQWEEPIGDDIERAIAVGDGAVYASAGGVYALDAETGEEEWMDRVDTSRGLAFAGETVFAAAGGGGPIVALDAATGDEHWRRELHNITTPTVDGSHVFIVGNSELLALDTEDGETDWTADIDRAGGPPTVTDDTVVVGTREDLFAHDVTTGDREWTLDGSFRNTDIAARDGTLYLTGRQQADDEWVSRALAVDAATGEIEWTQDDDGLRAGSAVVTDDLVYITTRYRLYALDRETGEIDWWLRFQWQVSSPAIADETLYVNVGGRLLAIESGEGDAGVWPSDADPLPDRGAAPPEPSYADTDQFVGMAGYDVDSHWDGTVEKDAPLDVSVAIEGDQIDDDQAVSITVAMTNERDERVGFTTGAPEPFGILWLRDGERSIAPWTDSYEESGHVHTAPHRGVTGVNSIALGTEIPPGETVSKTYTLSEETHGIRPGTYEFSLGMAPSPGGMTDDREGWEVEVTGTVELSAREMDEGDIVHDLAVADTLATPEAFAGELTADVLEPVTDTHPGLIEVTLENGTDEREQFASMRRWPFGSYLGFGPDGRRLVLLPAETFAPGFVEQTDSGWWEPAFLPHESVARGRSITSYDPGETSTSRFIVTTHPETDDPQAGDGYAFEQGYGDDDVDVLWGFALSTLDPDG